MLLPMTKISDALAHAHGLPKGGTLKGHKIVVEGFYFAVDKLGEKVRRKYREEFTLKAREHKVHGQGALGHLLSDKLLLERLSKKDPEFRAIQTHVVTAHENIVEPAPAAPPAGEPETPEQEAESEAPAEDAPQS